MQMATATVSLFSSECEVVLQNSSSFLSWGDEKGYLYGLWTHAGNVIVYLAIPDKETTSWKPFCEEQKLEVVGSWGTRQPKSSDRPATLDVSLGYIYIKRSSGKAPIFFSLPALLSGSQGCRQSQSLPVETTVTLLEAASPYREVKDPEGTEKLVKLGKRSIVSQNQSLSLSGHWSESSEHFDFLKDLRKCFADDAGLQVKPVQEPGSNTLAFQIKHEKDGFSCAIAFPSDFYKKRVVQLYRRDGKAVDVILPKQPRKAFDALLQEITKRPS
jgi:hypothetical protein